MYCRIFSFHAIFCFQLDYYLSICSSCQNKLHLRRFSWNNKCVSCVYNMTVWVYSCGGVYVFVEFKIAPSLLFLYFLLYRQSLLLRPVSAFQFPACKNFKSLISLWAGGGCSRVCVCVCVTLSALISYTHISFALYVCAGKPHTHTHTFKYKLLSIKCHARSVSLSLSFS